MGKKLSIWFSILLLLGVISLCSCKKDTPNDSQQTEIPMIRVDFSAYTMVRSQDAAEAEIQIISDFKPLLDEKIGQEITLSDDYLSFDEMPDSGAKEILIGKTNRPESLAAYEKLGEQMAYSIAMDGNKIVIAAQTPDLLERALNEWMTKYISQSLGDGFVLLPENMNICSEDFETVDLVLNGKPDYTVVYSRNSLNGVYLAVKGLYDKINSVASEEAVMKTDWIQSGQEYNMEAKEIVIGTTDYPESIALKEQQGYFGWKIKTEGNKIYIFSFDQVSLTDACNTMQERIQKSIMVQEDGTKSVRILKDSLKSVEGDPYDWHKEVPVYEGGVAENMFECSEGFNELYITETDKDSYRAYLNKLAGNGYTLYAENQIGKNLFAQYLGEKSAVYAYYVDNEDSVRLIFSQRENFTAYPLSASPYEKVADSRLAFMNMNYETQAAHDNGLGMIFTLEDGSFFIVDGGYAEETDGLYAYLKENNRRSDGKIVISAWMITHFHGDHYGNLEAFVNRYASEVEVRYLITQNVSDNGPWTSSQPYTQALQNALNKFSGCQLLVPFSGQKMVFANAEIEFLYTPELLYPERSDDGNNTSLVSRVTIQGQTFLITGDVNTPVLSILQRMYGKLLQSDFVQAPHHGLNGSINFYLTVNPKYALFSTAEDKYLERIQNDRVGNYTLVHTLKAECYFADHAYTVFRIPYMGVDYVAREYEVAEYNDSHKDSIDFSDLMGRSSDPT